MKKLLAPLITALTLLIGGCSSPDAPQGRGVYMLLDTSGTYTEELDKARQIIAYLLTQLDSGDVFAIARIDTGSFSEKDIIAKVVFDDRPSAANQQKRVFLEQVDAFLKTVKSSPYTDITGGLLQAQEFLHEHQLAEMTILVFSDMKEDLPEGYNRDLAITFDNTNVLAVNVTKLRTDNVDPQEYLDRLAQWQQRVETGGGEWGVINDLDRMSQLLK